MINALLVYPLCFSFFVSLPHEGIRAAAGVDVIRSFMHVMSKKFANKGMIFTTSYFTKDAIDEQEKGALLLDYKDKDEVINWVNKYRNK